MKIINLRLKTDDGNIIRLTEVDLLSFGNIVNDRFSTETKELFIICKQGNLKVSLDQISEIAFKLDKEESYIDINSWSYQKEKKDGEI